MWSMWAEVAEALKQELRNILEVKEIPPTTSQLLGST